MGGVRPSFCSYSHGKIVSDKKQPEPLFPPFGNDDGCFYPRGVGESDVEEGILQGGLKQPGQEHGPVITAHPNEHENENQRQKGVEAIFQRLKEYGIGCQPFQGSYLADPEGYNIQGALNIPLIDDTLALPALLSKK